MNAEERGLQLVDDVEALQKSIDDTNRRIAGEVKNLHHSEEELASSMTDVVALTNTNASNISQMLGHLNELKNLRDVHRLNIDTHRLEKQAHHLLENFDEVKTVLVGTSQMIERDPEADSFVEQLDDVLESQKNLPSKWMAPLIGGVVGGMLFGPAGALLGFKGVLTLGAISLAGAGIGAGVGKAGDKIVREKAGRQED